MAQLSDSQYQVLLTFRCALRHFLAWSASQASRLGLTPQQHQLLLAVRAHPGPTALSIRELSEYLLIRPHSAVELANRVEAAGLVVRDVDPLDQRIVRLSLSEEGQRVIEQLSDAHMSELQRVTDGLRLSEDLIQHLSAEFAQKLVDDADGPAVAG